MLTSKLRIISGGQTGIDRIALDVAMELGLQHGGWCPKGRVAEDGTIPEKYLLCVTDSRKYAVRTEKNIAESNGTLILYRGKMTGGTALTLRLAAKHSKPCLELDFGKIAVDQFESAVREARDWLASSSIEVLNVAGPRESSSPELSAYVYPFLVSLFGAG